MLSVFLIETNEITKLSRTSGNTRRLTRFYLNLQVSVEKRLTRTLPTHYSQPTDMVASRGECSRVPEIPCSEN